jgi:hypothetical protein
MPRPGTTPQVRPTLGVFGVVFQGGAMPSNVDFEIFDCDNHYYEAVDAFTRYAEPGMAKRTMQWGEIDGKQRLLVGGKVNRFIPNPTFDPISKPGALDEYFRGRR